MLSNSSFLFFFFFNDTATTEIYTLSLHDALPIWLPKSPGATPLEFARQVAREWRDAAPFVRPLADLYCQVRFGQTPLSSDETQKVHDLLAPLHAVRRERPVSPLLYRGGGGDDDTARLSGSWQEDHRPP